MDLKIKGWAAWVKYSRIKMKPPKISILQRIMTEQFHLIPTFYFRIKGIKDLKQWSDSA